MATVPFADGPQLPPLATALAVVQTRPAESLALRIRQDLGARRPVALVAGLPLDAKGREGPSALTVRTLAEQLQVELTALYGLAEQLPLHFVDERFSTAAILSERRSAPGPARRGQPKHVPLRELRSGIDAAVAAALLQGWLDRH